VPAAPPDPTLYDADPPGVKVRLEIIEYAPPPPPPPASPALVGLPKPPPPPPPITWISLSALFQVSSTVQLSTEPVVSRKIVVVIEIVPEASISSASTLTAPSSIETFVI
jgi:hypothetical protein